MDTSETYIKMCEKAGEIQTESYRCLMPDDMVAHRFAHYITTIWRHERGSMTTIPYSQTFIWLPRQDQLQEMVLESNHPDELLKIIGHFHDFACGVTPQFDSMEQLWLAFVMKEKYKKTWNGEEWIS